MEDSDKLSLEQIRAFLEASQEVGFVDSDRAEVYGWVQRHFAITITPSSRVRPKG